LPADGNYHAQNIDDMSKEFGELIDQVELYSTSFFQEHKNTYSHFSV